MPTLVFPAPGFTTSTQFTSTFATFLITVPGKVASRAKLKSIDTRSFGKVLPRSNIRGTVDRRQTFGKVLPRSNIRGLPVYTTPPKITTFKVPSNKITGPIDLRQNFGKLSPFVNQGLTSGLAYPVGGQTTISNNSINYIINDLDILATSTTASGSSQTLYFNPNTIFDPSKLTFTIGNYVKITNNNDFTEVVEVTTSTVNSITFDLVTNLPVDELGGLSIQLASNDLFPTTSVLANYYANLSTTGIWITPTNPRENLAVSQMELPVLRYRARQYYLVTKELSDTLPLLSSTTNSLSTFSDTRIPGDFRLTITGQTDQNTYNTVLQYINDLDLFTYTTSTVNVKVISFPSQDAAPFPSGSTVRIINSTVGYTQDFTVIIGTGNSVSFTNPNNLPVGGLTIEKTVASVYPQRLISTQLAPTNARENLYYFNISPGLRSAQQYFIAAANTRLDNGNLSRQLLTLKSPTTQLSVAKLSSAAKLKADSNILRVNKLGSAAQLRTIGFTQPRSFVSTITQFYSQITVAPSGAPTNARENFFYFNLAPGLRANRTIINGEIFNSNFLPTNLGLLKQPQANFVDIGTSLIKSGQIQKPISKLVYDTAIFNTGNLKSTAKLIADTSKFSNNDYILLLKIKSNTVQFFETPALSKLTDVTSLRPDRSLFTSGQVQNPISKLVYDTAIFNTGALKSTAKLIGANEIFNNEQIDVFKIRSNTVEMFETPFIGNVRPFSYNFVDIVTILIKSGQVQNPISKLVYDTAIFNTGALKSTAKLIGANEIFNNEKIDLLKIKSNTVQFFETPTSSKLVSVASLKSDRNIFRIDKLSATAVIRADKSRLTTDNLKSSAVLKEYGDSKKLYKPDNFSNYIDQITVRPTTAPTNASERFYYFNLAPGYRRNSSIQDGKSFSPISNIIKNDRLELFDNIGYQLDLSRIYNVSGQTTGVTSNTVLVYLDDLDILTTTTTPIDSVTIFFENSQRLPFSIGDTVYVTKNQDSEIMPIRGFIFTVLESTFNSITITKPADWDTTWTFSTIRLTGAEYYPREKVRTTVAPTNAREALYYAELGPGIRTNRTISYGNTFDDIVRIKSPDASIFRYIAGKEIPGASGFIDTSGNLAVGTLTKDIFKLRGLLGVNTISLLTRDLLKLRAIAVNDSKGLIVKLIVGDGKLGAIGFTDTGATKKEPIQFWN